MLNFINCELYLFLKHFFDTIFYACIFGTLYVYNTLKYIVNNESINIFIKNVFFGFIIAKGNLASHMLLNNIFLFHPVID